MTERDTKDVLSKARVLYETAQLGLSDLAGNDPRRRISGFHNAVVFGRTVTFVLQNLRSIDAPAFDTWYEPYVQEMKADPLMSYFKDLRSSIEKEGDARLGAYMYARNLSLNLPEDVMAAKPPGATSFFMGDRAGGSGWMVPLPDGTTQKFYVQLPESMGVQTALLLPDAPAMHLGSEIRDRSAPHLVGLYLAYLGRVLDSAEQHFV